MSDTNGRIAEEPEVTEKLPYEARAKISELTEANEKLHQLLAAEYQRQREQGPSTDQISLQRELDASRLGLRDVTAELNAARFQLRDVTAELGKLEPANKVLVKKVNQYFDENRNLKAQLSLVKKLASIFPPESRIDVTALAELLAGLVDRGAKRTKAR